MPDPDCPNCGARPFALDQQAAARVFAAAYAATARHNSPGRAAVSAGEAILVFAAAIKAAK
jgi:hypothetical protein